MGEAARSPTQVIGLPQGGGALSGLGEKFSPDLHTGTGNLTVPLAVPPGRRGFQPKLDLGYSTGNGNGLFGLGWSLSVPSVVRKTDLGVPRYDTDDVFVLSGQEDLVPIGSTPGEVHYRPRTEGLFAEIVHLLDREAGVDHWQVTGKDGLTSRYGSLRPDGAGAAGPDPATITDPGDARRVYAWTLTEMRDPLGNLIRYEYDSDEGETPEHRWRQPLLRRIRYADHLVGAQTRFLVEVSFEYEDRPDEFSHHRAGFEIRTTRRCRSILTATSTDVVRHVKRHDLRYLEDPHTGISLLSSVQMVGFDDADGVHEDLPPLEFGYGQFRPEGRTFRPVTGSVPPVSLAGGDYELVDATGDGLPDVIEIGTTARYWRNLGDGALDWPRSMRTAPEGARLRDPGVQLLDVDGDGRADLLLRTPATSGSYRLGLDGTWEAYRAYPSWSWPSFGLKDAQVRLLDLTGDGVTDVLRAGSRLECWFLDPERGWTGPRPARGETPDGLPAVSFTDPRVRLADLTGDGLQDLVLVNGSSVRYWPNLGHGRFGRPVTMLGTPTLPARHDPARLLLGDVSGSGAADLIYVDADSVTVWFNRSGNEWSAPVVVKGTPAPGATDSLRIADLLGSGTAGVLYSRDAQGSGRPSMHFLDLTGGGKPRLLESVDNNIGAVTEVTYAPSTHFALDDARSPATRWRTPLPVVVPVVRRVVTTDPVSRSRMVAEFSYHHGYWDGAEREFRGFACVDRTDTESSMGRPDSVSAPPDPQVDVPDLHVSPPTLTRTWFHQGPVESAPGPWTVPDWSTDYWDGDLAVLPHTDRVDDFLAEVRKSGGPGATKACRDAVRTLRGLVLRTELFALDEGELQGTPYTVTENAYDLREESAGQTPLTTRVFFPMLAAERSTQWERGEDPLTRFTFTGGYDEFGQPGRLSTVAMPRRSSCRRQLTARVVGAVQPDERQVLATHVRTRYASGPTGGSIHDRVAQVLTYELAEPPAVHETNPLTTSAVLADQGRAAAAIAATFDRLDPAECRVVAHTVNHYDGEPFTGLDCGSLGEHGLLTRTASLVLTDDVLDHAYAELRPAYLGGPARLPAGAPGGFGEDSGYRRDPDGPGYLAGWYVDTLSQAFDVQLGEATQGNVRASRDPLGHETSVVLDAAGVFPVIVTDPLGLVTSAVYDYRAGQPSEVTDPNGTTTHYTYHPSGLLQSSHRIGPEGDGDTADRPAVRYTYDLDAFRARQEPIHVHTVSRVWFASAQVSDDVVESRTYSDGFGRLVQSRAQADELSFGEDAGLLLPDAGGLPRPSPGRAGGPATGHRDPTRVVVSGWTVYDNKGRVVQQYEPFFDSGWAYDGRSQSGRYLSTFYDPLGRVVRTVNPDGSQRLELAGHVVDRNRPDILTPSPWVVTAYDENDAGSLGEAPDTAPPEHHFTPTITVRDALGRTIAQLEQGGDDPAEDGHLTRRSYDIHGNLTILVDEHGRTALLQVYDLVGASLRTTSPDAGRRVSIWNAAGAIVQSVDARGCVTLQTYDALNRPTAVLAADGPDLRLTTRERIEYGDQDPDQADARSNHRIGRMWRHHDEAGLVVSERYDFAGRLRSQSRYVVTDDAIAGAGSAGWVADWSAPSDEALEPNGHRIDTAYDALGRPVHISAPADAAGRRPNVEITYGRSGAAGSITVDGRPYLRLISHNARGQRVLVVRGNGLMTRYAYDADSFRLVRLRTERATTVGDVYAGSGATLQDLTYGYDLVGNITSIEESTSGCGIAGSADGRDRLVRMFGYDAFYRLVSATGRTCADVAEQRSLDDAPRCGSFPGAPTQANAPDLTVGYREMYDYDPAGNLVDLTHQVTTGLTRPRWHRRFDIDGHPPGESVSAEGNRATAVTNGSAGPLALGYDSAGNLTAQGESRTYVWNHAGRLVGFREGAGAAASVSVRYLYGSDGTRVKKWVRRSDAPGLDQSTVAIGNLWESHRWAEGGGGTNAVLHVLDGTDRMALVRSGPPRPGEAAPEITYELDDHIGSSTLCCDGDGDWTNREEYFPYGETSFGSYARKKFRFQGAERDDESGLSHHGQRYYFAAAGRWISCDPAGPVDGANLYAAMRANPLKHRDRTGQQSERPATTGPDDVDEGLLRAAARGRLIEREDGPGWLTWLASAIFGEHVSRYEEHLRKGNTGPESERELFRREVQELNLRTATAQLTVEMFNLQNMIEDSVSKAGSLEEEPPRLVSPGRSGAPPTKAPTPQGVSRAALEAEGAGGQRVFFVGPSGADSTRVIRFSGNRITYDSLAPASSNWVRQDMGLIRNYLGMSEGSKGAWWSGTHGTPEGEFAGRLLERRFFRTDTQVGKYYDFDVRNVYGRECSDVLSQPLDRPTVFSWCFSSSAFLCK
jgi:RHS repeat-associated protein